VLVTETFDYDGDRQVTAYVPRDAPQAVVFAGDVVTTERVGSHGDAFWREELPLMVAWAYGR
jgi:hypothetical protein